METTANLEAKNEAKKQKIRENNKSDKKNTRKRLGSHSPIGNEIYYMDFLGKVIHGDENNVCL